jgi:hypothetical protein
MNRKITHHFPVPLQGADQFARWVEEYGKARHVRDLVYAGANDALKGTLSDLGCVDEFSTGYAFEIPLLDEA